MFLFQLRNLVTTTAEGDDNKEQSHRCSDTRICFVVIILAVRYIYKSLKHTPLIRTWYQTRKFVFKIQHNIIIILIIEIIVIKKGKVDRIIIITFIC